MPSPLSKKVTLADLRAVRTTGVKLAMLTCYDFTTARLMQEAGVPLLLVGDSAANVVLGYDTTLPVSLEFMIEITAAVRRGAPLSLLIGDMPFGSYGASVPQGVNNVAKVQEQRLRSRQAGSRRGARTPDPRACGHGRGVVAHLGPQTAICWAARWLSLPRSDGR